MNLNNKMDQIGLTYLDELEQLGQNELEAQLNAIDQKISQATLREISRLRLLLHFYQGNHRQRILQSIAHRQVEFQQEKFQVFQNRQPLINQFSDLIYKIESCQSWQLYYMLAILVIMGFLTPALSMLHETKQITTYVRNTAEQIQFTLENFEKGLISAVVQKRISYQRKNYYLFVAIGIIIVISLLGYGLCGLFGCRGLVARRIAKLERRKRQIEKALRINDN